MSADRSSAAQATRQEGHRHQGQPCSSQTSLTCRANLSVQLILPQPDAEPQPKVEPTSAGPFALIKEDPHRLDVKPEVSLQPVVLAVDPEWVASMQPMFRRSARIVRAPILPRMRSDLPMPSVADPILLVSFDFMTDRPAPRSRDCTATQARPTTLARSRLPPRPTL